MKKNLERYLTLFVALKRNNLKFADMAREIGRKRSTIHDFAYGRTNSPIIKSWVKENLGIEL